MSDKKADDKKERIGVYVCHCGINIAGKVDLEKVAESVKDLYDSRFALTADTAKGFFVFLECIQTLSEPPFAIKGQITGPVTFGLGLTDQNGKAIFYDEKIRDVAVKLIAQKARWQVKKLSGLGCPVMIFFDEPALAGF